MNVQILENGNLELTFEDNAELETVSNLKTDWIETDENILIDGLEQYSCNGSFVFFDAGVGNPNVGLTSAPCIAEQLDWDDKGNAEIIGNFWYYDNYMTKSFIDELINHGKVTFKFGGAYDE